MPLPHLSMMHVPSMVDNGTSLRVASLRASRKRSKNNTTVLHLQIYYFFKPVRLLHYSCPLGQKGGGGVELSRHCRLRQIFRLLHYSCPLGQKGGGGVELSRHCRLRQIFRLLHYSFPLGQKGGGGVELSRHCRLRQIFPFAPL